MKKKNIQRLIFYPLLLLTLTIAVLWMKHMPGKNYSGPSPQLSFKQQQVAQKYKEQVTQLASKPRSYMFYENLEKTKDYIVDYLKPYENNRNKIVIQSYLFNKYKNIELVLEPSEAVKQTVVIGAHYDSVEDAPGADDNFSSVVILMELAKRLGQKYESKNTRIRIVFFTNEEPPFFKTTEMGSRQYAQMLHEKQEPVIAMYAFDMLGFYSEEENSQHYPILFKPFFPNKGNFVGFVSNLSSRALLHQSIQAFREDGKIPSEGVTAPTGIVGIDFSDHSSFYLYGWNAIMITDTAFYRNLHYHTHKDTPDKLNYEKMSLLTDNLETMFRKLYEK